MAITPTDIDLDDHPEELLDRAVQGTLAAAERQALLRHLSVCRACAAHLLTVRSAQKLSAPEPWDHLLDRRAVEGALKSVQGGGWPGVFSVPFRRRWALVSAGVLIGLGGMAGATWWHGQRARPDAGHTRAVASAAPSARPRRGAVPAVSEPAGDLDADPSGEPQPSLAPAAPATNGGASHKAARTEPTASSLFQEASALRDQNRPEKAVAIFRRLQRLYPTTREARLSFALAGRLLLDGGHPAQALAQFDHHLAQRGEAAEEALAGRATALGQMGQQAAESETWRTLLEEYPKTVYAPRAKSRLAELDRSSRR
jgi:hypothetical protein